MPAAIIGGIVAGAGAIGGAAIMSGASSRASRAQATAAERQLELQREQAAQQRQDFAPFREAGVRALGDFNTLAGLQGADKQMAAIEALRGNPLFQSLYRQGQEAVLQNASATGGLRGGNTQRSLADFGSDTLARVYQQQLGTLGGLVSVGAGANANLASLAQSNANAQSAALGAQGQAAASNALAQGGIWSNAFSGLGQIAGGIIGGLGGSAPSFTAPSIPNLPIAPMPGVGWSGGGILPSGRG
jgi:hypothetical protein